MEYVNGPGFAGLYAGDVVQFKLRDSATLITSTVATFLVFVDHVQVRYGSCGYTVDASNFVRLVRRGRRHMLADRDAGYPAVRP